MHQPAALRMASDGIGTEIDIKIALKRLLGIVPSEFAF